MCLDVDVPYVLDAGGVLVSRAVTCSGKNWSLHGRFTCSYLNESQS